MTPQQKLDELGDRLKKNHEHPYDLSQKGKLYDALKQCNDKLVKALEEINKLAQCSDDRFAKYSDTINIITKQALKNNSND